MQPPGLWVEAQAFGARVLRAGDAVWATPGELGLFYKELQRWLALDLIELDLEPALQHWIARKGVGLRDAEALLDRIDDSGFHDHVAAGRAAVLGAGIGRPVVLSLPGPARLLKTVLGDEAPDEGDIDDVAVALTGLVREVWSNELGGILLHEGDPRALAYCQPLINVARNYETPVTLVFDGLLEAKPEGPAVVYDRAGAHGGRYLAEDAWETVEAVAAPAYARIPAALAPDRVLERLTQWRER